MKCFLKLSLIVSLAFANSTNGQQYETASNPEEIQSVVNKLAHVFHHQQHRNLEGEGNTYPINYQCNEIIATITPLEVAILSTFLADFLPLGTTQYGIQVQTVCASCSEIDTSEIEGPIENYCSEDIYGYDQKQSGLVMIPLVQSENGSSDDVEVKSGTLLGFVHARSTRINRYDVPSQFWSDSPEIFSYPSILLCFLSTAIKGAVSFAPDYMGYGLSESLFKPYTIGSSYPTAFLPIWVKVANDLRADTDCKTALADKAVVQGYSEGGYGSVVIAEALNKALGVDIAQVRSGAGPFDLTTTFMFLVKNFGVSDKGFWNIAVLIGAAFSSTYPDVANYNVGQNMLNDKYMDASNPELNVIGWLDEENVDAFVINERLFLLSQGIAEDELLSEIWNPNFIQFMQNAITANITDPCSQPFVNDYIGVVDKLCEAFKESTVTDALLNVKYPVRICHGIDDELVPFANVPNITQNLEYLTLVKKEGGHNVAGASCITDDILYLASPEFLSIVTVNKHIPEGCPCHDALRSKAKKAVKSSKQKCKHSKKGRSIKGSKKGKGN